MSDETTKMGAFFEALADHVDALSDEELVAECVEEGRSPVDVAKETRAVVQRAVKTFKQRSLMEARRERELSIERMAVTESRLPRGPRLRRDLLAAMMAQPGAQGLLTAHGREFAEFTDEDVKEAILELMYLGVDVPGEKAEE